MGKYHITGQLEWHEERDYRCTMQIEETIESDSEAQALAHLRKTIVIDADEEDELYSSGAPGWDRIIKKLTVRVLESADPEEIERQERMDNLAYMRQYSSPLFVEPEGQ